jgi:CBS-domain-containing membrane protein
MVAKDLMHREVFTVQEDQPLEELTEMLVHEHLHGAPVLSAEGELVGVVTQQDIFFSSATLSRDPTGEALRSPQGLKVRDVMTSPAVSATAETDIHGLCRMMHRLRIHRVPIVHDGKLIGIVSSLDVCAAVARGDLS